MNRKKILKNIACVALPFVLLPGLSGQEAPRATDSQKTEETEEVFELSPFVVSSEEDEGYAAQYTLAGTRIRTDIKDVGSSITVVTQKFLADTGTTNATQLLVYTPNTEVVGQGGNFLGVGDDQYAGQVRYGSSRVRGLSNADNTRDFFLTDIPWDSYNTGRIDIQRGPNSILFGIGSPAGIINASLNRASYKDSAKLQNKVDNFGTVRFSGDFNKVLIDKELAIRISLLNDETKYRQEPAFRNDKRFYAALRYDPSFLNRGVMKTTFEASYEKGEIEANLFRAAPPTDYLTAWFDMAPGLQATGYTMRQGVAADSMGFRIGGAADSLTQGGTIVAYNQTNPTSLAFPHNVSGNDTWFGNAFYRGIIGYGTAVNQKQKGAVPWGVRPGASIDAWKNTVITNRSVFDSYTNLLDGDTKRENMDFDALNLALRQSFWDDTLGYELAYDVQNTHNFGHNYLGTAGYGIAIDVMGTLQGGVIGGSPNPAGGTFAEVADPVNPNLGRAFVVGARGSGWSWNRSEKTSSRATAYYNLDFKKLLGADSKLAQILGKNTFTGLLSNYIVESRSGSGSDYFLDDTSLSAIGTGSGPVYFLNYLSQTKFTGNNPSGINLPRLAGRPVVLPVNRTTADETTKLYSKVQTNFISNYDLPEEQRTYFSSPGFNKRSIETSAIVWQGHWFGGNVIPLAAYRTDTSWFNQGGRYEANGTFSSGAPRSVVNTRTIYEPFSENYVLGEDGPKAKVRSKTYSVVTHTPKFLREKLPGNIDVQLIYNQSENFQPSPGRTDIVNRPIPDPVGETKEYGFAVSALNDKLYLKVVHYETKAQNVDLGNFFGGNISSVAAQEVWARSGASAHAGKMGPVGSADVWQADRIYGYSSDGNPVSFKPYGPWAVEAAVIGGQAGSTGGGPFTVWDGRGNGTASWNGGNEPYPAGTVRQNYTQAEIDATWAIQKAAMDAVLNNPPSDDFITANGINRTTFFSAQGPGMFDYGGGAASAVVTGNTESEGLEFELVANPIKGLSVMFNASKTKAKRASIAQSYLDYVESRRPFFYGPAGDMRIWSSGEADAQIDPYTTQGNGNMSVAFRAQVDSPISKFIAAENTFVPELHPWSFNVIANYEFQSDSLKGFSAGGGYRWQDKLVTGYPITLEEFGNEMFDFPNPYYGPSLDAVDLWVGYKRKIGRKYNWQIQLNVRNVFADDKLIMSQANPDGTGAAYRIPEPRLFVLTNTLEF